MALSESGGKAPLPIGGIKSVKPAKSLKSKRKMIVKPKSSKKGGRRK